jgi:hypothetical protein
MQGLFTEYGVMNVSSLHFIGKSIAAASLLTLAIPAQASGQPPVVANKIVSATEGGQTAGKDEKLICKRFENSASRMKSVRACHTKADWRKIEDGDF